MTTFKSTKRIFKQIFNEIINESSISDIDEAAFPAYAHKNILIDYLFWKRIEVAFDYAQRNNNPKKILDFGCGSGVLTYLLANNKHEVTSTDIEFSPLNLVKEKIDFPSEVRFIEGDIISNELNHNYFDIIYALDVLEHVDNIEEYIKLFEKLLTPNGVIIVSGPTENIFYKVGRIFAGKRFTGDYHLTNIAKIKQDFKQFLNVNTLKKLFPPITLFELFTASKH
ncbi:class I SAM-dependent methyltransferase [Pseudofulvibacter geojedonensis]|uniref:Class I SAM-dependent methyltransferase n=1 Tax=Pseudofulvibacter geojedonensis TaxID=1123758 RepID=A0ABW3I5Z1_9FLAO